MEHAPAECLVEMICGSIKIDMACQMAEIGMKDAGREFEQGMQQVAGAHQKAAASVSDRIEKGKLLVVNGTIIDQEADSAGEDEDDDEHDEELDELDDDDEEQEIDEEEEERNQAYGSRGEAVVNPVRPKDFLFSSSGNANPHMFLALASKFGFTVGQLQDPKIQAFLADELLVATRAEIGAGLCKQLGIECTNEQICNVARCSLAPDEGVPLSAHERMIAQQLYFHALKDDGGGTRPDGEYLDFAQRMLSSHAGGITTLQRIGRWFSG
jgi:hypothetical protein